MLPHTMNRLITIPMSHYNERARWALDVCGVPYREQGYLPLLHFAPVAWYGFGQDSGRADRASGRYSTPLLVTSDGERIHDSGEIVAFAARRRPGAIDMSPEAIAMAQSFHDRLGPRTRRLVYHWSLPDREMMIWTARQNVGRLQSGVLHLGYPVFRAVLRKALGVRPERAERALDQVRAIFDEVSNQVRDKPFLVHDRFSTADLTFASLAALALGVQRHEGYGAVMPPLERCPSEARNVMNELRETKAGKFALRMFRDHRRPS